MVELEHRADEPAELVAFRLAHPTASVTDFNDNPAFRPVKSVVKAALHGDQDGLCAYCERPLAADAGQIDHIRPKGGPNAHPHLCFAYRNYAHSCIDSRTCGQKKKNGLLPIEPGPGCNADWTLSMETGDVVPRDGLTNRRRHEVEQTRGMLGLNAAASDLVKDRLGWLKNTAKVLQQAPDLLDEFLDTAPYRHLLRTVF
jgi:uncharacterized protein (TIGR02646 family)